MQYCSGSKSSHKARSSGFAVLRSSYAISPWVQVSLAFNRLPPATILHRVAVIQTHLSDEQLGYSNVVDGHSIRGVCSGLKIRQGAISIPLREPQQPCIAVHQCLPCLLQTCDTLLQAVLNSALNSAAGTAHGVLVTMIRGACHEDR